LVVLTTAIVALFAVVLAMAVHAAVTWLKVRRRPRGRVRNQLFERLYGLNWGDVTTNNYGFAPAEGDAPERYQLQMYTELMKLLCASGRLRPHTDLLETGCGRGGGLVHLVQGWPDALYGIGLDYSANALRFCRRTHGHIANLAFVRGSALALPFADESFDMLLDVEASNDYDDYGVFLREVHRVLRPGGAFLCSRTRHPRKVVGIAQSIRDAGFEAEFYDITDHVAEACRLDNDRRRQLIRTRVPWYYRILLGKELANYAAIEGSRKLESFRTRRRLYIMICATKVDYPPGIEN
jgi:ubiquinone/menaquinone biosynthesis C-methylase UbiE